MKGISPIQIKGTLLDSPRRGVLKYTTQNICEIRDNQVELLKQNNLLESIQNTKSQIEECSYYISKNYENVCRRKMREALIEELHVKSKIFDLKETLKDFYEFE